MAPPAHFRVSCKRCGEVVVSARRLGPSEVEQLVQHLVESHPGVILPSEERFPAIGVLLAEFNAERQS